MARPGESHERPAAVEPESSLELQERDPVALVAQRRDASHEDEGAGIEGHVAMDALGLGVNADDDAMSPEAAGAGCGSSASAASPAR
jgi:hypothetical protein